MRLRRAAGQPRPPALSDRQDWPRLPPLSISVGKMLINRFVSEEGLAFQGHCENSVFGFTSRHFAGGSHTLPQ